MSSTQLDSPIGAIRIEASGGAVVGVYLPDHKGAPPASEAGEETLLARARAQLREYFEGERLDFDLPLSATGTAFQEQVWAQLRGIPFGERRSYGALAKALGKPGASRAVGAANGRNPLSIVVPCHRVVGADGRLTGYAGGEAAKRWLLDHEARISAARRSAG